jgi:peptide deformylase
MTIRKVISKSKLSLQPCQIVTDIQDQYIQQAIQDLLDTLAEQQAELDRKFPGIGGGVGLAANQIEYPYQPKSNIDSIPKSGYYPKDFPIPHIYVMSIREARAIREQCEIIPPTVYINANFTPENDGENLLLAEGCLSIVGIQGIAVPRAKSGILKAYNQHGDEIVTRIEGFPARVHQHEIDHCHGKEFLNNMHFTQAELQTIISWVDQRDKDPVILANKLICTDLSNVDLNGLSLWVKNELN